MRARIIPEHRLCQRLSGSMIGNDGGAALGGKANAADVTPVATQRLPEFRQDRPHPAIDRQRRDLTHATFGGADIHAPSG